MITYNMRYRGAYEYDKFALNIFQFLNLSNSISDKINKEKKDNIVSYIEQLNEYISYLYGNDTTTNNIQDKLSIYTERNTI